MSEIVRLQCFREGKSKLRVRVISPGYNLSANCQFPSKIREEGRLYTCPARALSFSRGKGGTLFYRVTAANVTIVDDVDHRDDILKDLHVYEEKDCVVCLSDVPGVIFLPCGHFCVCEECCRRLSDCPMCRAHITGTASRNEVE